MESPEQKRREIYRRKIEDLIDGKNHKRSRSFTNDDSGVNSSNSNSNSGNSTNSTNSLLFSANTDASYFSVRSDIEGIRKYLEVNKLNINL
jgi:hypothetical protein